MSFWRSLLLVSLCLSLTAPTYSQSGDNGEDLPRTLPKKKGQQAKKEKPKRPTISPNDSIRIQYASSPWNTASQAIDSAAILVKDRQSGKMAQINLEETEPDSSVFSGTFLLNWGTVDQITPEVYVPPQSLRSQKNWVEKATELIDSGRLPRKPFLFEKKQKGMNTLEVFDSKTQAAKALRAYQTAKNIEKAKGIKIKPDEKKKVAAEAIFEAAQLAAAKEAQRKLEAEAAAREAERVLLAQLEKQKELERIRQEKQLAAAEKAKRRRQAADFAAQAMEKYKAGQFKESVDLFEKSVEFDPTNKKYYYQYGVALYKTESYNKAIVILDKADDPEVNQAEKNYFLGLAHLRLQEFDKALDYFGQVKGAGDKVLSPSAAFYQGVIYFDTQRYEQAKPPFEFVLDNSEDPRLDERAEAYIERIAQILYFAQQQKTKFFFSGTFGLQYDSNILFSSDSSLDEGTALGEGGVRLLGIGGAKWRPIYKKQHEFSTDLDLVYYYSLDDTFAAADPFLVTFSSPYTYKGTLFGKGYNLKLSPGYEVLFMDVEETGSRGSILTSVFVEMTNTFVLQQKWFTDIELIYRQDDSSLEVDDPATSSSSATKITASNTHTFFLNKTNSKMATGNIGYTINDAEGSDNKYGRIDLGGSYIQPLKIGSWELSWVNTLSLYLSNYSERSDDRKDTNYGLNTSVSKALNDNWTIGLSAGYTRNSSTVDTFTYNQWNVLSTASFNYAF